MVMVMVMVLVIAVMIVNVQQIVLMKPRSRTERARLADCRSKHRPSPSTPGPHNMITSKYMLTCDPDSS